MKGHFRGYRGYHILPTDKGVCCTFMEAVPSKSSRCRWNFLTPWGCPLRQISMIRWGFRCPKNHSEDGTIRTYQNNFIEKGRWGATAHPLIFYELIVVGAPSRNFSKATKFATLASGLEQCWTRPAHCKTDSRTTSHPKIT